MYTVGQLAKRFGLSRSTLLYYDAIGLLCPSARSAGNYRLYTEADAARMEQIVLYRDAGVPLEAIGAILKQGSGATATVLRARLAQIGEEMASLQEQQRVITTLLQDAELCSHARPLDKAQWIAILRASGLQPQDMERWHREFERLAPEAHGNFLVSLGIPAEEVARIRAHARGGGA